MASQHKNNQWNLDRTIRPVPRRSGHIPACPLPIDHCPLSTAPRLSPLAACLLFFLVWITLPVLSSTGNETGWLRIFSPRAGWQVFVNDSLIGVTPLDSIEIEKGIYTLRIHNPESREWLNDDRLRVIVIAPDTLTNVVAGTPERIWLDSDPSQAEVFADSLYLGRTPLKLDSATAGARLVLKKKGFQSETLTLPPFTGKPFRAKLNPESTDLAMPAFHKDGAVFRSPPILLTGTAALLTGVAGYIFKSMAEKAYRRYQSATRPEDMNHHFNQAVRYDQWSGICYVTCEINLCTAMVLSIRGAKR